MIRLRPRRGGDHRCAVAGRADGRGGSVPLRVRPRQGGSSRLVDMTNPERPTAVATVAAGGRARPLCRARLCLCRGGEAGPGDHRRRPAGSAAHRPGIHGGRPAQRRVRGAGGINQRQPLRVCGGWEERPAGRAAHVAADAAELLRVQPAAGARVDRHLQDARARDRAQGARSRSRRRREWQPGQRVRAPRVTAVHARGAAEALPAKRRPLSRVRPPPGPPTN